ncbi:PaaI family thioesterase [Aquicoccus sp. SU-CL01552]|uniref:PaaI family thioesterase n=1 Tax=Aquicoccus sp. SU-CL01552 TaxID=3127656 RepID=UPI0031041FD3
MTSASPDIDAAGLIHGETGAQTLIGWTVDVGQPDRRARLYLDVDDRHSNRHGVLHGGIQAMLLDSACGYTGALHLDHETLPQMMSLSFNTHFLAPCGQGRVMAIGRVTGGGKRTLFIEGTLFDADDRLVATGTGVYRRVPPVR